MSGTVKVLLLGDYSNCQRTLATGLRRKGCDVTLMSDGSGWQHCERDIDMSRRGGKWGGLELYLKLSTTHRRYLRGYDVVSVHDPNFVGLKPDLIKRIFTRLKSDNGAVFLNAMSTDLPYLDMLEAEDSPLAYSEWFVNGRANRHFTANKQEWERWHKPDVRAYQELFYDHIDGAVAVLYEYYCALRRRLPADRVAYGGIPIDLSLYPQVEIAGAADCVKLFLGRDCRRVLVKGSDYLEKAARAVVARHRGAASLTVVENRPFSEFVALMRDSHVVLDQIYSYTPATTALMAMAYGLCTVSGGEEDFYRFIGEDRLRPVINAPTDYDALEAVIEHAVTHPEELKARGESSREFVEKHNACETVAGRYLDFWISRLDNQ